MSGPIGSLRRIVTIEAPRDIADGAGGATRSYEPIARVHARIESTGGETRFDQQRQEAAITHVVTIRWRADVGSETRFALGARRLLVRVARDPDEARRFLVCRCEEIAS